MITCDRHKKRSENDDEELQGLHVDDCGQPANGRAYVGEGKEQQDAVPYVPAHGLLYEERSTVYVHL